MQQTLSTPLPSKEKKKKKHISRKKWRLPEEEESSSSPRFPLKVRNRRDSLSLFHLIWFPWSATTFASLLFHSFPFVLSSSHAALLSLFLRFRLAESSTLCSAGRTTGCVLRVWMSMTAAARVFIGGDSAALAGAKILTFGLVEVGPSARSEIPDTDSPNWDSCRTRDATEDLGSTNDTHASPLPLLFLPLREISPSLFLSDENCFVRSFGGWCLENHCNRQFALQIRLVAAVTFRRWGRKIVGVVEELLVDALSRRHRKDKQMENDTRLCRNDHSVLCTLVGLDGVHVYSTIQRKDSNLGDKRPLWDRSIRDANLSSNV